jgi:hypothetical protein
LSYEEVTKATAGGGMFASALGSIKYFLSRKISIGMTAVHSRGVNVRGDAVAHGPDLLQGLWAFSGRAYQFREPQPWTAERAVRRRCGGFCGRGDLLTVLLPASPCASVHKRFRIAAVRRLWLDQALADASRRNV